MKKPKKLIDYISRICRLSKSQRDLMYRLEQ